MNSNKECLRGTSQDQNCFETVKGLKYQTGNGNQRLGRQEKHVDMEI